MSKNHSLKNQNGYNTWSSFYDDYPNPTVAIDDISFPAYWEHLEQKEILEIGCGTGRHTQRLLKQNNKMVGIDVSEGMLNVARKKLSQENLSLIHADFLIYEFQKEKFDAVICSLVIEHIVDLNLFFQKVQHCLRPNGILYLSEIHPFRTSQGIMAHFRNEDGEDIHLSSHPHTENDFETAATSSNLEVVLKETVVGNDHLPNLNPKWIKHLNSPLIQIWMFKKTVPAD